jgi:hypothetical protein
MGIEVDGGRPRERDGIGGREPGRGVREGDGEGAGVGEAARGLRLAGPLQDRDEDAELGRHLQVALDPGQQGGQRRVGGKRDGAGYGLHQDQRQRVDVGAGVDDAPHLLGGGVAGGAEHGPGGLRPAGLGQRPGQAEVGQPGGAVLVEEEVGRLHVAVDEPPGVGVVEAGGDLAADGGGLGRGQSVAPVEEAPEAAALEEFEDHEWRLVFAPVVDSDDVGVVQGRRHLRLGAEAAEEPGVVGQGGVKDLDGHLPLEPHVPGRVDAPAGPRPQGGNETVPTGQDTAGQIGHAARPHHS